jgi:hypothetical protein
MSATLGDALRWITGVLADLEIPYQVVGGLAAVAHGSRRPLNDVDLYVPDDSALERLASAAGQYVIRPPMRHRDEHWDLCFLKLTWADWEVEAAAASGARVWDRRRQDWSPVAIRFHDGEEREVHGVRLRVMPLDQLVDYKLGLGREVDRADVVELAGIAIRPKGGD